MKKIVALALLMVAVGIVKAEAASITASISSTSFATGANKSEVLLLHPKESLTYTLTGSATGTIVLEKSVDGLNFVTVISSVNNSGGTRTGTEASNDSTSFYRWRASTMTGSGSFTVTLYDNDDFVGEIDTNKKVPLMQYWDDGVRFIKGKLGVGDVSSIPLVETTSGNSVGQYSTAYLSGTLAAVEGNVLCGMAPVSGYVTVRVCPATNDLTSVVGVSKGSASVGSMVEYYYSGFVLALTTGTVSGGNSLVTTTNAAGYFFADTTPTTGADYAVALGSGVAAGGLTRVRLK